MIMYLVRGNKVADLVYTDGRYSIWDTDTGTFETVTGAELHEAYTLGIRPVNVYASVATRKNLRLRIIPLPSRVLIQCKPMGGIVYYDDLRHILQVYWGGSFYQFPAYNIRWFGVYGDGRLLEIDKIELGAEFDYADCSLTLSGDRKIKRIITSTNKSLYSKEMSFDDALRIVSLGIM